MQTTFENMADLPLEPGPIQEADHVEYSDLSATIGLVGPERASLLLAADRQTAVDLTRRISGRDAEFQASLVADTLGEILNIIAGAAQRESALKFDFSLPVVVRGSQHEIIPFETFYGRKSVSTLPGGGVTLLLLRQAEST